jgi:glycine cleavage system H lipoate-binding protein
MLRKGAREMAEKMIKNQKKRFGYGGSYRRGSREDLGEKSEIGAVFGGQVWMFTPEKTADVKNPCIWMQAGVVTHKDCNNFYDCNTCKYDLGMKKQVERNNQISWQDAMRKRPGKERTCRHSLTRRIENRICGLNYNCSKCDFDQFFEDVWTPKTGNIPFDMQQVKGFDIPMEYFFHNGHTWARIESGGCIRIGLDDFALKLFGRADTLDLPLTGKELDKNTVGWGLRRNGNPADILSPVGGVIVEVNSKVRENPEIANESPYGDGWLFMVRTPDVKKTVKHLMTSAQSLDWLNNEIHTLEEMIEALSGPSASDGGYLQKDIYGTLPDLGWDNLTKTFLKT